MYQLINLYQPVFRRQPKMLSAVTLLSVVTMALVLLSSVAIYASSTTQVLQQTSEKLALSFSQLNTLVVDSTSTDTARETSFDDQVAILQHEIEERNALLERIDELFVGSAKGFGNIFEILAKTTLDGLWLTGVELDYDGNIDISGTTIDPNLVPRYLYLVAQHPELSKLNIGSVNLTREESNHLEINFTLSYSVQGELQ